MYILFPSCSKMLAKQLLKLFWLTALTSVSQSQRATFKLPKTGRSVSFNCQNFNPDWRLIKRSFEKDLLFNVRVNRFHTIYIALKDAKNQKFSRYLAKSDRIRNLKLFSCLQHFEETMTTSSWQNTNVTILRGRDELGSGSTFQPIYNCIEYRYRIKAKLLGHEELSPVIYESIMEQEINLHSRPDLLVQSYGLTEVSFLVQDNNRDCKILFYTVTCIKTNNQKLVEYGTSNIFIFMDTFVQERFRCFGEINYGNMSLKSNVITVQIPAPRVYFKPINDTIMISGSIQYLENKEVSVSVQYQRHRANQSEGAKSLKLEEILNSGLGKLESFTEYNICLEIRKVKWQGPLCPSPSNCYRDCTRVRTNPGKPTRPQNLTICYSHNNHMYLIEWEEPKDMAGSTKDFWLIIEESCISTLPGCPKAQSKAVIINSTIPYSIFHKFVDFRANYEYNIKLYCRNDLHKSDPSEANFRVEPEVNLTGVALKAVPGTHRNFLLSLEIPCDLSMPKNSTFMFYRARNRNNPEVTLTYSDISRGNLGYAKINAELNNFRPNSKFYLCVLVLTRQTPDENCVRVKSPEDSPDDPPITKSVSEVTSHSFHIDIDPPKKTNGNITHYTVSITKRCRFPNVGCPNYRKDCIEFIRVGEDYTAERVNNQYLKIQGLNPNTEYQFKFKAANKAGLSPPSVPINVTTCADLTTTYLSKFNFTTFTGDTYIYATINRFCPYMGGMKFQYSLLADRREIISRSSDKVINSDRSRNISEVFHFENLQSGKVYDICLTLISVEQPATSCSALPKYITNCHFGIVMICEPVPKAQYKPRIIQFQPGQTDFNPFTSLKIIIPADTFNGSRRAIKSLEIVCPQYGVSVNMSSFMPYNQDSSIVMPGIVEPRLDIETEVTIHVKAVGCNDSVSITEEVTGFTIPLQNISLSIKPTYQDSDSSLPPGYRNVQVTLTESVANVKFWNITNYLIGKELFYFDTLFDKSTGSINQGGNSKCRTDIGTNSEDPMKVLCHMVLAVPLDTEYLPMKMFFKDNNGFNKVVELGEVKVPDEMHEVNVLDDMDEINVQLENGNGNGIEPQRIIYGFVGGVLILFTWNIIVGLCIIKRRRKSGMTSFSHASNDGRESEEQEYLPMKPL